MPQLNAALVPAPAPVVVRFTGDADLSTEPFVADVLAQAAGLGTPQVVVDLASSRFWDCSCLHALVAFTRGLEADGRAGRIVGALPATCKVARRRKVASSTTGEGRTFSSRSFARTWSSMKLARGKSPSRVSTVVNERSRGSTIRATPTCP